MKNIYTYTLLFALCFGTVETAEAANYDGEKWTTTFNWMISDTCPAYVKTSVEEMLNKHGPVDNVYQRKTYVAPTHGDRSNVIYCGFEDVMESMLQKPLPRYMGYNMEEATGGRARWSWYESSLQIVECDVWLSTLYMNQWNVDKYTLHEVVGHCMGLRHSDIPDAVMYFAPYAQALHVDDYAGLYELYEKCDGIPYVDVRGNIYLPKLDIDDLLEDLDRREYDKWVGINVSAMLDANEEWPNGVYNIKESACD